jgi:signal transduction histidine kinase
VISLRRGATTPTLRGRVSLLTAVVLAAWLIVLAAGFDFVLISRSSGQIDDALRVRAQSASATVVVDAGRVTAVRDSATDSELDSSIWVYAGHTAIERPNESRHLDVAADAFARSGQGYAERLRHRFYVLPIRAGGRRIGSVVAAIDLGGYDRTRDTAIVGTAVVTVLLLAGAYPALRFGTGRALRPVDRMTRQAADWSVNSPQQRFGPGQEYAELSSLAGSLDELLDRLAAVLRHERHLSAELSHELRTPLSRVAGEIDLMLRSAREDQLPALNSMREGCRAMDSIMETLLAAARRELAGHVGRSELGPVFERLAADHDTPRVTTEPTSLSVGVDPALVDRMLGPVLENARRYAATGVHLAARRDGTCIAIDISNDGATLPPDIAERVFEPGFRAERADGHPGAGLGLALARRLARSADGDLTLDLSASATTFCLVLPAG